jgi:hypothetical protein
MRYIVLILIMSRRRLIGHIACMGQACIEGFGGFPPEGKRPLGRPGCMSEVNIKKYIRKVGWGRGH